MVNLDDDDDVQAKSQNDARFTPSKNVVYGCVKKLLEMELSKVLKHSML